MREYGKISPLFWTGKTGKQIVKSGPECIVIAMHLLTSPHANALGHYYIPLVFISHETGIPLEGVQKGFERVCELGFCTYDIHTEVVWVYEMGREQIGTGLKENDNRVKWVNEQYRNLPKSPFLYKLYEKYKDSFHIKIARGVEGLSKGVNDETKPLRSLEQEQEHEQDIDKSPASSAGTQNFSQAPPPSVISSANEDKSKHFRNHVGEVLQELIRVCKSFEGLPAKEKAFNSYQLLQDAVNVGYHPGAILEVFRDMVDHWQAVKDPWPWFHSICNTRSQNFYAKEKEWQAEDYKETIADLAKQDLFKVLGLKVKTL